jgi:hypothetical protein
MKREAPRNGRQKEVHTDRVGAAGGDEDRERWTRMRPNRGAELYRGGEAVVVAGAAAPRVVTGAAEVLGSETRIRRLLRAGAGEG